MIVTQGKGSRAVAVRLLEYLTAGRKSVLDLGCGYGGPGAGLPFERRVNVDLLPPQVYPKPLLVCDAACLPLPDKHFDVSLALDLIEHLPKERGGSLLREMERLSDRAILFTPLGELWLGGDGPHSHQCGWLPQEFEEMGWQVWAWPDFHHFGDGSTFGAFWAWRTFSGEEAKADVCRDAVLR